MGNRFKPEDNAAFAEFLANRPRHEGVEVDLSQPVTDEDGYDPDDPDNDDALPDLDDEDDGATLGLRPPVISVAIRPELR